MNRGCFVEKITWMVISLSDNKRKEYEVDERMQYTDHMSEIIRKAETDGHFDDLPGKGKPLQLGQDYMDPPEKQLYKTMKDNNILPEWVKIANEIDLLKEDLNTLEGKEKRKKINVINKKIKAYNYTCPSSLQKYKLTEE